MPHDTIGFSIENHVARITLDNRAAHNALGRRDVERLRTLLDAVEADATVRVLLLDSAPGDTFCAGASLKEMRSGAMSGELFNTLTDRLAALGVPSVCAIGGNVFGGGAELALCCDHRIGVRGMRLVVPAARIGLCYPPNGMRRYVEKLGLSAAMRILVAVEELPAETLLAIGYLQAVVEADALATEARAVTERIAKLAPLALRAMKRLLTDAAAGRHDATLAASLVAQCANSADLREGLAAQRERRAPHFEGR